MINLRRLTMEVKLKHPEGKRAYCDNAKEIVEEAEGRNLTRAQIAKIANVDPKTVYIWKTKGYADPKAVQLLVDYLNSTSSPKPHNQAPLMPTEEYAGLKPADPLLKNANIHQTLLHLADLLVENSGRASAAGV
jgi:hypothetical protein